MFNREIYSLWCILTIFTITYVVRGVWDYMVDPSFPNFRETCEELWLGLFCDFLPIMLLLIFHMRNFREKKSTAAMHISGDLD